MLPEYSQYGLYSSIWCRVMIGTLITVNTSEMAVIPKTLKVTQSSVLIVRQAISLAFSGRHPGQTPSAVEAANHLRGTRFSRPLSPEPVVAS